MNDYRERKSDNFLLQIISHLANVEAWVESKIWRHGWLSYQINEFITKSTNQEISKFDDSYHEISNHRNRNLFYLVIKSFLVVFGPWILIYLFSFIFSFPLPGFFEEVDISKSIGLAAEILASVLGLIFVLAVFMFDYFRGREFERSIIEVFLYETRSKFLITFGILSLLSLACNFFLINYGYERYGFYLWITVWNLFLFASNLILLIWYIMKVLDLLFLNYLDDVIIENLRSSTFQNTLSVVRKRIWTHLLSNIHDTNEFEISYTGLDRKPGWFFVSKDIDEIDQVYEIKDINLRLIQIAAKRAKKFKPDNRAGKLRILSQYWERFDREKPAIAAIPDYADRPFVVELIKMAYKLRPLERKNKYENDLSRFRDLIIQKVNDGAQKGFKSYLDGYEEVIREFLKIIYELNMIYSFEAAQKDTGVFSEWTPVTNIQKNYVQILRASLEKINYEILNYTLGFPYRVMNLAVRYNDHMSFQEFSKLYIRMYHEINKSQIRSDIRKNIFSRSWEAISNFYKYIIRPRFEYNDLELERCENLGYYCQYLIGIVSELMKISLDYKNDDHFRSISSSAKQIGKWLGGRSPIRFIEDEIPIQGDQKERDRLRCVGEQLNSIKIARGQAFLGLGGWLYHQYERGEISESRFHDLFTVITSGFSSINDLYSIYTSLYGDEKIRRLFGWDWWELKERPSTTGEPTFQPMRFDSWLSKAYTYLSYLYIPASKEKIPDLEPHISIESVHSELLENIEYFEKNNIWEKLKVNMSEDEYKNKKELLIEMHKQALKKQEIVEEEALIKASIEEEMVDDFREELTDAWNNNALVRNLVDFNDRYYENREHIPESLDVYKYQSIDPKGVFVDQKKISYIDWGGGFGRGLANFENKKLSEDFQILPVRFNDIHPDDLEQSILVVLKKQEEIGNDPYILFSNPVFRGSFRNSEHFVPEWMAENPSKIPGIEGRFDGIPLISMNSIPQEEIIIIDMSKFADLIQYPPNDSGQFPLFISVEAITEEKAHELLERYPQFPKDSEAKEILEGDEAIRWFMKNVLIEISERIRFEDINNNAGARIVISLDED